MAKKVVIVDEELTPTVLATKKVKRGSMIWLIIIFAAFILAAIKLPEITAYVNDKFNLGIDIPEEIATPNKDKNESNDDEEREELIKYQLTNELSFTVDDLTLSNFVLANNKISFTIKNNSAENIDLSQKYYYLNLYNTDTEGNDTLLFRIKVSDNIISANNEINLTYDVSTTNINEVAFLEITPEEYPAHILTTDTNGNGTMKCIKGYETVTYSFNNNQVNTILDNYTIPIADTNYNVYQSTYQVLASTYNNISGVTSNVSTDDTNLYFITNINLRTVIGNTFNNEIYYPLNTDAKVINFELEAQGYTCE